MAGNMAVNRSNKKVLIVEDNDQTAQSLAQMIGHLNVQCEIASDGCEAVKLLEDNQYFLVIADTHMPKVSGCELLKHIKSNYPEIPVAVISTNDTESTRGLVVKNRADFYLPKPITMSDVQELITIATGLRDR
jgi:CheY-like chemotaxis protein